MEEEHFFFNGVKSWPLVWLVSIPTVGSKCAPRSANLTVQNCPSWLLQAGHWSSFHVNRPDQIILGDRGISGDYFGARVVNFGGHARH